MKKFILLLSLVALASCGGNKTSDPADGAQQGDSTAVVADSTIYGTAIDQGMSVFLMQTEKGDTLEALKDDEVNGKEVTGQVYGGITIGDRFAVTLQEGSDSTMKVLKTAINLSTVESIVGKEYCVCNGQLIVKGDTVDIVDLTETALKAKSHKDGKDVEYTKK